MDTPRPLMPSPDDSPAPARSPPPPEAPRRDFLTRAAACALGAAAGGAPAGVGLYVAAEPLRRRQEGGAPFLPVAPLDALPADNHPHLFTVLATREDAWTRSPRTPVGAVYLRRSKEKPEEILALHSTCPHLGCFVAAQPDGSFHCPCHDSDFRADGAIGNPQSPSLRGLDRLQVRVENGQILVQFLNFAIGTRDQRPDV